MGTKTIFGYGSLISQESLRATSPHATDIRPVYITGFRRNFSLWDPIGYTTTNLDLAGKPFCALDVQPIRDPAARVNGIVFTVSGQDFEQLLIRELEYNLIETTAYDYSTGHLIGTCEVFSSGKNNASFDLNSAPAKRYLEDYLQAAKRYGDEFYQEILETTFIGDRQLSEHPELIEIQFQ